MYRGSKLSTIAIYLLQGSFNRLNVKTHRCIKFKRKKATNLNNKIKNKKFPWIAQLLNVQEIKSLNIIVPISISQFFFKTWFQKPFFWKKAHELIKINFKWFRYVFIYNKKVRISYLHIYTWRIKYKLRNIKW